MHVMMHKWVPSINTYSIIPCSWLIKIKHDRDLDLPWEWPWFMNVKFQCKTNHYFSLKIINRVLIIIKDIQKFKKKKKASQMNGNCVILHMSQLSKLWNNESRFILLQNLNCLPIRNILRGRVELKHWVHYNQTKGNIPLKWSDGSIKKLVLLWAQLTKIYPPLPTSVQPISITKTLLIVPVSCW